jgi:class II lanthipeptide synthase
MVNSTRVHALARSSALRNMPTASIEFPEPLGPATCLPRHFNARVLNLEEYLRLRRPPTTLRDRASAESDLRRFFAAANQPALDQYLRLMNVTRDDLLAAISVRFVDAQVFQHAPWYRLLGKVLSTRFISASKPDILGAEGLNKPLYPLLNWADARIDEWCEAYDHEWGRLRAAMLQRLSERLGGLTYKTFILEANILMLRDRDRAKPDGRSVIDQFAQASRSHRYVQRLYLTYPALARLLATCLLQWWRNTSELLDRLHQDTARIEQCILRQPLGRLQGIDATLSDPHDEGKQVLILRFSCGQKLVYKPRSVDVDVGYQRFIEWLNMAGIAPQLRVLHVVAGADYGWVEFVETAPLPTEDAARQFYLRHGIHLAILYLLKAADFHSENVIASGEQPVLVDLETLLHADTKFAIENDSPTSAEELLHNSVFACGLLPGWTDGDLHMPSPDLSGIGTREGQFYRDKGDIIEHGHDGTINVVRSRIAVNENANQPTYGGNRINPALYGNEIAQGFDAGYRLLQANAAALAAPEGPLAALLKAKVRHVALSTAVYASLLRRAAHPDFLTRAVYRELIFAILAYRSVVLPSSALLLRSELAALFVGDVPKFVGSAATTSVFDEHDVPIADFLREDAATSIRRRIGALSDDNMKFQKQVIRMSMATLRRRGEPGTEMAPPYTVPDNAMEKDQVLHEVRGIATTICDKAIVKDMKIDWIGLSQGDYGRSRISAVGPDLYDGIAGIGLFLGYAGARLADDRLLTAARSCGLVAREFLQRDAISVGGGYSGRSSIAYGLMHIAMVLNERAWLDRVIDTLPRFAGDVAKDSILDVIGGSAGTCGVLLAAHRLTGEAGLLQSAVRFAEHVLAKRIECETGYGWPSRNSRAPLTGFSHGAAGIGWALINVGHCADRPDFVRAGMKAFEYERSLYSNAGWPDLRETAAEEAADVRAMAWCHGGPGIGLSRATLPAASIGAAELTDIENALEPMRRSALAPSDCLCHGEFGNIELLLCAAGPARQPNLRDLAKRRATAAIGRYRKYGAWRCGAVPNEATPGLLIGLAGIGYGMLRCYASDETPSILALQPPLVG